MSRYPLHVLAAVALVLGAVSLAPATAAQAPTTPPAGPSAPQVHIGFTDAQLRDFAGGPVDTAVAMLRAAGLDVAVIDLDGAPSAGTVVDRVITDGRAAYIIAPTP